MLKIFLIIVGITYTATALNCYDCSNDDDATCSDIKEDGIQFLKECPKNMEQCAVQIENISDDLKIISRKCVETNFKCETSKYKCDICNTDGCNKENEISVPIENKIDENLEVLAANIPQVVGVAFVLVLLVIYCIYHIKCKKKNTEYDEDEDDFDVYYENETTIDLEIEKDPPLKKTEKA